MNNTTNHGFTDTGWTIWQADRNIARKLYAVSDNVRSWDNTSARFALYSDLHDVFSYVDVKVTGRKVRWDHNNRLTVRVVFTDDEEAESCGAEILKRDGKWFEIADAKELLGE